MTSTAKLICKRKEIKYTQMAEEKFHLYRKKIQKILIQHSLLTPPPFHIHMILNYFG